MSKKTPLFDEHVALGGRIIDFGGWQLPVQYTGLADEHTACRNAAGIFDVSHMGEFHVFGKDAQTFLNLITTNDLNRIPDGKAQYSMICNSEGGILDDLISYKYSTERFLVVVNAANIEKDFAHFQAVKRKHPTLDVTLENRSDDYAQIALQGPKAVHILQSLCKEPLFEVKPFSFFETALDGNIPAIVARTGYTGEDGFEIYLPAPFGREVWKKLLVAGKPFGLKPCGLGARDTLRLEVKYPLYGQDLTTTTTPLEAGLSWAVRLQKAEFEGKDSLVRQQNNGLARTWVGFKMNDKAIARSGYAVFSADGSKNIGRVTSGTLSPSLGFPIGTAYIDAPFNQQGQGILIEIRGQKYPAEVVPTPFYKRS